MDIKSIVLTLLSRTLHSLEYKEFSTLVYNSWADLCLFINHSRVKNYLIRAEERSLVKLEELGSTLSNYVFLSLGLGGRI